MCLGPEGTPESVVSPLQIVFQFDVPLRAIRSDLESDIEDLRRRRGAGRIQRSRGVMGSRPVMAGTRIPADSIHRMLSAGWDDQRIIAEYTELTPADIAAVREWQQ